MAAGALILAQAGMLIWDTFLGRPRDPAIHAHEAPRWMIAMPAIPALLSLALGLLPEPERLAAFFANAAAAAYGDKVKVSLALWAGITPPLILSIVAVSLGTMLWVFRAPVRAWQNRVPERFSFNRVYAGALDC